MTLFPGQYDLLFVLAEGSRSYYLGLTPAQQAAIKAEVSSEIQDRVWVNLLQAWDFSHNKIYADAVGHKSEAEVRNELEAQLYGLGRNGYQLSIMPDGVPVDPIQISYDKQWDCGRSCHHAYSLHVRAPGGSFSRWNIRSSSHSLVVFEMRASLMWITPGEFVMLRAAPPTTARVKRQRERVKRAKAAPPTEAAGGRPRKVRARKQ